MTSRRKIIVARRNVIKARRAWIKMSHAKRKKRMPSRPYRVHTKRWHDMVNALKRKGNIKNPEAVATWKLGPKAFLKRRKH